MITKFHIYEDHQPSIYDIYNAIAAGDLSLLKKLLKKDISLIDKRHPATGFTPLIKAALGCEMNCVKELIDFGADWLPTDDRGRDFMDFLKFHGQNYYDEIKREYPNKFKEYIVRKETKKYNL